MKSNDWHFFMSKRHRRLTRIWQSFFAGWGLFFTITLIASPFVFKNITWAILNSINMDSIQANNLFMTNLTIRGRNNKDEPFSVSAAQALQKFAEPGIIHFTKPVATTVRRKGAEEIQDRITAETGLFKSDRIILTGNVVIKSSDGSTAKTNEMEIGLR